MMLMLTESTLFFVNMMRLSSSTHPNNKAKLLANVNQWSLRMTNEWQVNLELLLHSPSITMAMSASGPPSTILSDVTQSTEVTRAEDADYTGLDWEDTYHSNFGEDDDDTQEQEAAWWAGKIKW